MQPLVEGIVAPQGSSGSSAGPAQQPPSALEGLRSELRSRWPEWAAISSFAALVAFAIPWLSLIHIFSPYPVPQQLTAASH